MQYPGFNVSLPTGASNFLGSNFPEYPSPLVSTNTSSLNATSTSLPASTLSYTLAPPSITLAPETLPISIPNKVPNAALTRATLSANLYMISHLITSSSDTNVVIVGAAQQKKFGKRRHD
ncbi:hypothetical protein U1Q18_030873, partial [Sarracenia purpurea var. burkii]